MDDKDKIHVWEDEIDDTKVTWEDGGDSHVWDSNDFEIIDSNYTPDSGSAIAW